MPASLATFFRAQNAAAARKRARYGGGARTGGFLGIESKFIDSTRNGAVVASQTGAEADPATVNCLNAIAQGDGESNRDGRKCTLTSLHLRGLVTLDGTETTTLAQGRKVRVIVVHDTQTNGAQLNSEDVYLTATNVGDAYRNLQFVKRFKILKDATFDMNPQAGAGNGTANDSPGIIKSFKWNFKFKIPVVHNGTTANVSTITDSSLHVIAFANSTGTTLAYESRIRFVG